MLLLTQVRCLKETVAEVVVKWLLDLKPDSGHFNTRGLGVCPIIFTIVIIGGAYREIFIYPDSKSVPPTILSSGDFFCCKVFILLLDIQLAQEGLER